MNNYLYWFIFIVLVASRSFADGLRTNEWGPVTNNVKMSIMVNDDSPAFSADDIAEVSGILERLRRQSDPVSVCVWKCLSDTDQLRLMNLQPSAANAKEAQDIILQALNKIIGEPCIYEPKRFEGITLRVPTVTLLDQNVTGPELARLNRLLLEDAFPLELSRNPKVGNTSIKIRDPVVITILFTNVGSNDAFALFTAANIESEVDYSFLVISPSGEPILLQPYPIRSRSGVNYDLPPHAKRSFKFRLSLICAFDQVGTYTITAKRLVRWPAGAMPYFTVVSNPLKITILP